MNRSRMLILLLVAIGATMCVGVADVAGVTADSCRFIIGSATAFNQLTRTSPTYDDSMVAKVSLWVKYPKNGLAGHTLNQVSMRLNYNSDSLVYLGYEQKDWTNSISVTTPSAGIVSISLYNGTRTLPINDSLLCLSLSFKLNKVSSGKVLDLHLVGPDSVFNSVYTVYGGTGTYRYVVDWPTGHVTVATYLLQSSITPVAVTNGRNTGVWTTVRVGTNARSWAIKHRMTADTTRLQLVPWSQERLDTAWHGGIFEGYTDLETIFEEPYATNSPSAQERPMQDAYRMQFKILSTNANDSIPIHFLSSASIWYGWNSSYFPSNPTFAFTDGYVKVADTAIYSATKKTDTTVGWSYTDAIDFKVRLRNTFDCGRKNVNDTVKGIRVAIKTGSPALKIRPGAAVTDRYGNLAYDTASSLSDSVIKIWQKYDASGNNLRPVADTTLFTAGLYWDNVTAPKTGWDWGHRYIKPRFVSSFGSFTSTVPDTLLLLKATDSNGLVLGSFDSVQVRMGRFITSNAVDWECCMAQQKVRLIATFQVDSFAVKLTCDPTARFSSVTPIAGVTATVYPDSCWLRANNSFSHIPAMTDSVIASVWMYDIDCSPNQANVSIRIADDTLTQFVYAFGSRREYCAIPHIGSAAINNMLNCGIQIDTLFPDPGGKLASNVPRTFSLDQNYPNPFNPTTTICMNLPEASSWKITIFNMLGQEVKRFTGSSEAGTVKVEWNASDMSSGVYLYRAEAGSYVATKKMLLMK